MSLSVRVLAPGEDGSDRVLDALRKHRPLPFSRTYRLPEEAGLTWLRAVVATAAETGAALVVERDGEVVGGAAVVRRPWESGIYGCEMARIPFAFSLPADDPIGARVVATALLSGVRGVLEEWGVSHCSALVMAESTGMIHALESEGWRLVDSSLEMAWEAGQTIAPEPDPRFRLRAARESDRVPLMELARTSYVRDIRTRYSADPWLPLDRTGALYAEWCSRALDGAFADVVVVAEADGRPAGFNTFKVEAELTRSAGVGFAAHGIAAVDPACRGLRMQPAMLHWLAEWHAQRGGRFSYGRVLTSNYTMQRACLRAGGFIGYAYHGFHLWLGRAPAPRSASPG
jgi:GNAT superfamily N-acetyltransferase